MKDKKALIIVDNFSGHKLDDKEINILREKGILIKFLRPYTTSLVQPLDLSINRILKSQMKEEWISWFSKNPGENPTKTSIYSWFHKAFKSITPVNIIKAFILSGISNDTNGSEDILSSNLQLLRSKNEEITRMEELADEKNYYWDVYESPEYQYYDEGSQKHEGEYVFENIIPLM